MELRTFVFDLICNIGNKNLKQNLIKLCCYFGGIEQQKLHDSGNTTLIAKERVLTHWLCG